MGDGESTLYYVIPEGASQEETCTWEEIESFCETGRLSPNSLVYLPDTQNWEKVVDTDLSSFFEDEPDTADNAKAAEEERERLEAEYESVMTDLRESPDQPRLYLSAAAAALALGEREAAVSHYQQLTDLQPFNKSNATEIKRNLRTDELRRIRQLERPDSAWDDVGRLVTMPLARGWMFFVIPAAALAGLALIPTAGWIIAAVFAWLWMHQTALDSAGGGSRPPHWRAYLDEPLDSMAKPLLTGVLAALELAAPFVLAAVVGILLSDEPRPGLFEYIQGSVAMMVLIWVTGIIYLPAVVLVAAAPDKRWWDPLNVVKPVQAVIALESEYITGLAYFFGFGLLWGGLKLLTGSVPVAGVVLPVLSGLYGLIIAAFVLGRMSARSRHQWAGRSSGQAVRASTDTEQFVD